MEKGKKNKKEKAGCCGYINENCWLAKNLSYSPYARCRYCRSEFRNCLFLHYQIISLALIVFFPILSFLIEGKISELLIISIFALVIVYGYFFNISTNKIIQANFTERKAKEALEELSGKLELKVDEQTKELRIAYEGLKKLDQAKSEFVSMASHQLRTPLSAIKGYASMLSEGNYGKLKPKQEEKLKKILISNERLIGLVNDLLDISKIDLGKMELDATVFQMEKLVDDCYQEIMPLAKEKGLKFVWEKPTIPLPKIEADELKIKEVVSNLFDNSVKYTQTGEVIVKLEKVNSRLRLSVKDTGEGVTKEDVEKLFQTFGRGSAGINTFIEGTGLGLMVAKRFVDLHKGKLWVESEGSGKGSIFYLELPIKV